MPTNPDPIPPPHPPEHVPAAPLPLAAAATILMARALPVRFEYRPNDLGIVSATTLARYPHQQETFWFAFGLAAGSAIAVALTVAFAGRTFTRGRGLALEIAGATSLAALLVLGRGYAEAASLLSMAVFGVLAATAVRAAEGTPRFTSPPRREAVPWRWLAASALLALLLTPGLPGALILFLARAPDPLFAENTWWFQGEVGQRIAWADRLLHGQAQGRDFFCLYGPLGNWGLEGLWTAFGRSVAAWHAYSAALNALGFLGMMILGACLVRRRAIVLLLPFLTHDVQLRLGFGFFGLACLMAWIRSGRRAWCLGAGAIAGASILFSQEYGIAFVLTAGVALLLRGDLRAAGLFALGVAAPLAPALAWHARVGALAPMLRDLAQYPAYVVAGFGKLPFPPLLPHLPLRPGEFGSYPGLMLRSGYTAPAILASAILLALPISASVPRRPLAWAREAREVLRNDSWRLGVLLTAVYGLLSFRTALGRSDLAHIVSVMAVPAILLVAGLDRAADLRRGSPLVAAWRMGALALVAWVGAFVTTAEPVAALRANLSSASLYLSGGRPLGDPEVNAVAAWVRERSSPTDPVMFVPGDAAYYYLADRRNPTRFDLSHQMVTDAHRAEALADMRARPPRWIAWDDGAWRVDGIPDSLVFGSEMLAWIDDHYEEQARLGSVRFLGPRRGGAP